MHYEGLGTFGLCCVSVGSVIMLTAVPLFFMISGALLLTKDEPLTYLFRKRVLRFALVIAIFWAIQYAFVYFRRGVPWDFGRFLELTLCDGWVCVPTEVSWYLYAYIGLLLILPFTRILARNFSNVNFLYLFALQFCFCWILPTIYALYSGSDIACPRPLSLVPLRRMPGIYPFNLMYGVFYMLLGYFLEHRLKNYEFNRKHLFVLYSASSIIIIATIVAVRHVTGSYSPGQLTYGCLVLPAAALFLTAKRVQVASSCIRKSLQTFSGAVLFVMLTENLFRILLGPCTGLLAQYMPLHLANLCFASITCLAALCIGAVVKRFSFSIL